MNPADDEKRVAFLCELLLGASATLAALRAGASRGTVYRWKLEDQEFAALWAEIMASRPRRRELRRRVLQRAQKHTGGREARLFASQVASHGTLSGTSPEAAWDKDFGPAYEVRR